MYKEIQNKTFRRSGRCEMNKSRGVLSHRADHIRNIQIFCTKSGTPNSLDTLIIGKYVLDRLKYATKLSTECRV